MNKALNLKNQINLDMVQLFNNNIDIKRFERYFLFENDGLKKITFWYHTSYNIFSLEERISILRGIIMTTTQTHEIKLSLLYLCFGKKHSLLSKEYIEKTLQVLFLSSSFRTPADKTLSHLLNFLNHLNPSL